MYGGERMDNNTTNRPDSTPSENRTTLTLSITQKDKITLKVMAAKRGVTISSIIHEWIAKEGSKHE